MTKDEQLRDMRNAIDGIELALMGFGNLVDMPKLYEAQRQDLRLSLGCTVGEMRQVCKALEECTRIINSPEYHIRPLKTA